jgi:hypothetical protein
MRRFVVLSFFLASWGFDVAFGEGSKFYLSCFFFLFSSERLGPIEYIYINHITATE